MKDTAWHSESLEVSARASAALAHPVERPRPPHRLATRPPCNSTTNLTLNFSFFWRTSNG